MVAAITTAHKYNDVASRTTDRPDVSFDPAVVRTQKYWVRIAARSDVCYLSCAYKVLKTVQRPGVCSAGFYIMHCNEPLKSFDNSGA